MARVVLLLLLALPAHAGWDAFSDARFPARFSLVGPDGLRLVLKGRGELSLRDIEGAGGDGRDSATDTVTLGTRTPTLRLDRVQLALRVVLPEVPAFYSELTFDEQGARARGAWFDWHAVLLGLGLHVEAGLNVPFVAIDDGTRREPLTSRVYWGRREMHLTGEVGAQHGAFAWSGGLSAAVMRPFVSTLINDASRQGTLAVLGAGSAEPFSGNAPVFGGRLAVGLGGVRLEGFGFVGEMTAQRGYDELRARIANYTLHPDFNRADPRDQDDTFWWAGGRLSAEAAGWALVVEAIESAESLLRRRSGYAQLGYTWDRNPHARWLALVTPWARAEYYRIVGGDAPLTAERALRAVDPSQALTWDWDLLTVGLTVALYRDLIRLHLEHSFIAEYNNAPTVGQHQRSVRNDENVVQIELRF
jgi:hypothetical protein